MVEPRTVLPYAALTPLYDTLLGDKFFLRLRRIFEQLVRHYGIQFRSVADVACGTGTFVRYLRERGVPVVYGVDRSPEMLRIAVGKNHGNGARFLLQDMLALQLPQPVDLITCNFDSLNYLIAPADLLQAFGHFRSNLKPGGWLIFDMITPNQPWIGSRPLEENVTIKGVRFLRWMSMDRKSGLQVSQVELNRGGRNHQELHRQRAYPISMVRKLLRSAGFRALGVHDFKGLGEVNPKTRRAAFVVRSLSQAAKAPHHRGHAHVF